MGIGGVAAGWVRQEEPLSQPPVLFTLRRCPGSDDGEGRGGSAWQECHLDRGVQQRLEWGFCKGFASPCR